MTTSLNHITALSILSLLSVSCGTGYVKEIGVKIPGSLPELDSNEALDPHDPSLATYSSQGDELDPRLTEAYQATLDPSLKWKYSSTKKTLDRPPTFDCEGYTRYVYRTFLGHEPWRNKRAAEILQNTLGFAQTGASNSEEFLLIPLSQAKRGDLVVWRIADGHPTDHVAIYDGYAELKKKDRVLKIAMVVSTSSSASAKGDHAIQRFPLQYVMPKTQKAKKGPYFVRVRY